MGYNRDIHHRRSIRLKDYDYSSNGAYYATICTQGGTNMFGVIVGADSISAHMQLNQAGRMIEETWHKTVIEFSQIVDEKHVTMPNHFHCLLTLERADMESAPTVGTIIQSFKRYATVQYINSVKAGVFPPFDKRIWQRNYYERVIRDENECLQKWKDIDENPVRWREDEFYA
jgi:REP element-mobilizing transposase RayT